MSHFQNVSVQPSSRQIGNLNRRHTHSIPRIEISEQRRDRPKCGVLKLALFIVFASILTILILSGCVHKTVKRVSLSPDGTVNSTLAQRPDGFQFTAAPPETEDSDDVFSDIEDEFKEQHLEVNDPLEPLNRAVFYFNDKLYFWAIKPLARGYNFVLPNFVRKGARNFFTNISMPIRLTNCILQGKATATGTEFVRFVTNTTIGILGVWDPALDLYDLKMSDEDFGQTLGTYGLGNGFYIVWPFLGPSSLRDSIGKVGDTYVNPITCLESTEATITVGLYQRFNNLTFRIGDYEAMKKAFIDPYTEMRNGYIQHRNALIKE